MLRRTDGRIRGHPRIEIGVNVAHRPISRLAFLVSTAANRFQRFSASNAEVFEVMILQPQFLAGSTLSLPRRGGLPEPCGTPAGPGAFLSFNRRKSVNPVGLGFCPGDAKEQVDSFKIHAQLFTLEAVQTRRWKPSRRLVLEQDIGGTYRCGCKLTENNANPNGIRVSLVYATRCHLHCSEHTC
jgi:hypothetical protein